MSRGEEAVLRLRAQAAEAEVDDLRALNAELHAQLAMAHRAATRIARKLVAQQALARVPAGARP